MQNIDDGESSPNAAKLDASGTALTITLSSIASKPPPLACASETSVKRKVEVLPPAMNENLSAE